MSQRKSYRAVIVSPHLDDAVFSCGATISRLCREGPVLVLNIFTRYLTESRNHAVVMSETRYQEEQAAAQFFGFETKNLGELDVSFRRPEYKKIGNVFRPPVPEDMVWLLQLRKKLFSELASIDFQEIYLPLGVGWNADHVLTHLAFDPWAGRSDILYYEEVPYCLIPHSTRYRLAELQSADDMEPTQGSKELFACWQTNKVYSQMALMKNLKPWWLRVIAPAAMGIYFYRLMRLYRGRWTSQSEKKKLKPFILPISDKLDLKIEAMMLYQSQFREFFLSREDCKNLILKYSAAVSPQQGAIERYWSFR